MNYRLVIMFLILMLVASFVHCFDVDHQNHHHHYISDGCDWQGSKLTSSSSRLDNDRSIMPIYLRCSRGTIKWFYPTGGLRVVLKLGTDDTKDFRGCIRVQRNTTRNVRIYIQGQRQMFQIFSANDGKHPDKFRCFVSVNHYMALFLETDSSSKYPHDTVVFEYDLQQRNINDNHLLSNDDLDDDDHDCKPCSQDRILQSYCSSELALTGRISYYHLKPELDLIEYFIKPFYIHRLPVNQTFVSDIDMLHEDEDNDQDDEQDDSSSPISNPIILNRPLKCANNQSPIIESPNRYLFLGRQMLGKFILECSIRLDHWKRISQRAAITGTLQCHI